jgi:hypothetical protein
MPISIDEFLKAVEEMHGAAVVEACRQIVAENNIRGTAYSDSGLLSAGLHRAQASMIETSLVLNATPFSSETGFDDH